jgi:outer membrane protein assembly factor BamD (BamD/ComL family)
LRPVDAEGELALLQRAQSLLDAQPAQTLALTHEHRQQHPRGIFTEEREVLAIEAQLKLRQRAAAVQRARRFLERFPRSTHAARVRELVDSAPPQP